jgi:hypothetical protein
MFACLNQALKEQCFGSYAPAFGLREVGGFEAIDSSQCLLGKRSDADKASGACLMTGSEEELTDRGLALTGRKQVAGEFGGAQRLVCTEVFEFGACSSGVERGQLRLSAR